MLGKPEWFVRRKYGGWGMNPKPWQGWAYIGALVLPLIAFLSFGNWSDEVKYGVTGVWIAIIAIEMLDLMRQIKKDERETLHEAMGERNAAWFLVAVLSLWMIYDVINSAIQMEIYVNPIVVFALLGAAIVKGITIIHLEKTS